MKVLLFGHYGHGNLGDDLLMTLAAGQLQNHPAITKLAVGTPESGEAYIRKLCPNVEIQSLTDGLASLTEYDRVLFGGGGTVFDYRSNLSIAYGLRKRASDFLRYGLARSLHSTRFASIGIGLGPFADQRAERLAMNRLRYHDFIYTRDDKSYAIAVRHGLKNVTQSHDLCLLECDRATQAARPHDDAAPITLIVRDFNYGALRNKYLAECVEAASRLKSQGHSIRWVSFQMNHDEKALQAMSRAPGSIWIWDPKWMTIEDAYQTLADSSVIFTARMHGTYLAGLLGVPSVSIQLHRKLKYAADYFASARVIPPNSSAERIVTAITAARELNVEVERDKFHKIQRELGDMFAAVNQWIGPSD